MIQLNTHTHTQLSLFLSPFLSYTHTLAYTVVSKKMIRGKLLWKGQGSVFVPGLGWTFMWGGVLWTLCLGTGPTVERFPNP